jgi:hypothetical protein
VFDNLCSSGCRLNRSHQYVVIRISTQIPPKLTLCAELVEPVCSERDDTNAEDATATNDPGQFDETTSCCAEAVERVSALEALPSDEQPIVQLYSRR